MSDALNVEVCRAQFPGLKREIEGRPAVFLDGPAGSQVPRRVIEAMGRYLAEANANTGGPFVTSELTARMLAEARQAAADLLGVDPPEAITFGPSMTGLTFGLSGALARTWKPGDEVVVTRLDHDANVSPWVLAAESCGARIRHIGFGADGTLNLEELQQSLSPRTRLVAVGAASNALGTVNPIASIAEAAHAVGAELFVDAVHLAPHRLIDAGEWNADYVVCSAYKFFGPHVGILWGRPERLGELPVDRLRPATDSLPGRLELGTPNHEGIAGTLEAIAYLADIGVGGDNSLGRREALRRGFEAIRGHEDRLTLRLLARLAELPALTVHGLSDPGRISERVPTISLTHRTVTARAICERLAAQGIFSWWGNYYAIAVTEALGLEPDGMLRVGFLHYNTEHEVDRLCEALSDLGN